MPNVVLGLTKRSARDREQADGFRPGRRSSPGSDDAWLRPGAILNSRARINLPAQTLDVEGGPRRHLRRPLRGVWIRRCIEHQQQPQREHHADQDRGPGHGVTVKITHDVVRDLPGGEGRNLRQHDQDQHHQGQDQYEQDQYDQDVLADEDGDHHEIPDDVDGDHDRHQGAHQNRDHLHIRARDDDDNLVQSRGGGRGRRRGRRQGREEGLLTIQLHNVDLRDTQFHDDKRHHAELLGEAGAFRAGRGR